MQPVFQRIFVLLLSSQFGESSGFGAKVVDGIWSVDVENNDMLSPSELLC